jgi:hypothetical protein
MVVLEAIDKYVGVLKVPHVNDQLGELDGLNESDAHVRIMLHS